MPTEGLLTLLCGNHWHRRRSRRRASCPEPKDRGGRKGISFGMLRICNDPARLEAFGMDVHIT